jgi:hypothetical protein
MECEQVWWKNKKIFNNGFDPVYWGEYVPSVIKKSSLCA